MKVFLDPGGTVFRRPWLSSLFPRTIWADAALVAVTHGDLDHYGYADRVARASGAPLVGGAGPRSPLDPAKLLSPRSQALRFGLEASSLPGGVYTLGPGEGCSFFGGRLDVTAYPAEHGTAKLRLGPLKISQGPGQGKRVGRGSVAFRLDFSGDGSRFSVAVVGDSRLMSREDWAGLAGADLLILPIGGERLGNNLGFEEALGAVERLQPRAVIPSHYNCPLLFSRWFNRADAPVFQQRVEEMGIPCYPLDPGQPRELAGRESRV